MTGRKVYSEDYLKRELDNISSSFRDQVTGYLIGGLAMIYHGVKNATKDVDIVFENEFEAMTFKKNLLRNGFKTVNIVTNEYEKMKTFWKSHFRSWKAEQRIIADISNFFK